MGRSKPMGIVAMLVVLVVVIVLLPLIVKSLGKYPHYAIAGFANMTGAGGPSGPSTADGGVAGIPAIGSASKLPTWRPDPNTDYLCRSPNEDGNPCPEGYFCDGTTQACIPNYVGNTGPWTGYFS
uniref:Uncharacterized protein n=1 Tax=viral metagenome TaxID=1070528 RepID=A0A6C0KN80_9ZZZZ